ALFKAGIHPARPAENLSPAECNRLADAIQLVLEDALAAGGATLRDFRRENGRPGYFSLQLKVYGRAGIPCDACGSLIRKMRLGQRSSFFC
ncbi:DNA-formamidopyrimidine glycosylase, partial [Citrobacter sp. AAK_AS5]